MKHREYICIGSDSVEIEVRENKPFLIHFQKAILLSLEDKKLITRQQRIQCEEGLEKELLQERVLQE